MILREFFTGDRTLGSQVDQSTFNDVRKNFVIATTDVLLINQEGEFYLAKRKMPPSGYWWIFGGRMLAGESTEQSAIRSLEKEFGEIEVNIGKLQHIGVYSLFWNKDKSIDHALLCAYAYHLSHGDKVECPADHSRATWFTADQIEEGAFHPAIKQIVADYQKMEQRLKSGDLEKTEVIKV